jgi:LasA protease
MTNQCEYNSANGFIVKRNVILFILASFLLASCIGNASLWGQYQTPTPFGWIPDTSTPEPSILIMDASPPLDTTTPLPTPLTPTPTSLLDTFVTRESTFTPTPTFGVASGTVLYYAQSGDWLPAVASRFGVDPNEITSPKPLPENGFIDTGTLLIIPDRLDKNVPTTTSLKILPDSEVVFSATAAGFDIHQYVRDAGGYLSTYREYLGSTAWTSGAQGIERLAFENSINPRLLLAILDYEARWVRGRPESQFRIDYPIGQENFRNKGLFGQMTWAINQLSMGYYGWRAGTITELTFNDGNKLRLDPTLNAGTVAVMVMFSQHHSLNEWLRVMDQTSGFTSFYQNMFGDPWVRAEALGNFFPPAFTQPDMILPFEPNVTWSYTGGPHSAWGTDGPLAAVDFAPRNDTPGCFATETWIVSIASGLVVRSGNGVVMVDMDGDGSEQTGWNILYLHVANEGRVALGQWVEQGDHIGHASCEGGVSTGTHTHIARKYNGEWMLADGPVPFVLSGWTVTAGEKPYLGKLIKGEKAIIADVYGQAWSLVSRDNDE